MGLTCESNESDKIKAVLRYYFPGASPFDILSLNSPFCLLSDFWPTRENRLKSSRWHFSTPRRFDALKTKVLCNYLIYNGHLATLNYELRIMSYQNSISTWQNHPFCRNFPSKSALSFTQRSIGDLQNRHRSLAFPIHGKSNRTTLHRQNRRIL